MGKKRRLNRFISKWIKSDLPEDRTTVLLLGVTRIPTSPLPNRRPCSLPPNTIEKGDFLGEGGGARQNLRRSSISDEKKCVVVRRNSSLKKGGVGRRFQVPTINVHHVEVVAPQVSVVPSPPPDKGCFELRNDISETLVTHHQRGERTLGGDVEATTTTAKRTTTSKCAIDDVMAAPGDVMERSVDSIGTCSLDVDASVDFSDWSEPSSAGTLRSASIVSPSPEPHLPSYLSLACTVNGYSTTTHYDPVRLASRSRDASPHRIDSEQQPQAKLLNYSVQNNLLSPPNIVPLPIQKMDNTIAQHRSDFYSSMKTTTYLSKQSFTSGIFSSITKDTTDSCLENGHHSIQNKCVSFETTSISTTNGQSKCLSETAMKQEYSNGNETKSFIQQRVERLYGPGALAQGFFITKPQKGRFSEIENRTSITTDRHSKSMNDDLLEDDVEPSMKQSTSSPTLPVLRHLRPEFRAQLPAITSRKGQFESGIQKSITIPKLKDEIKVNGHSKAIEESICEKKDELNGSLIISNKNEAEEKDGHYFLKILEDQANRLLELAARVENEISTDLSEEVIGILRSASGKARLFVSQKMQQFKGLCTNNINQTVGEAFPTTNEDLQGFWDMVMLQVNQIDALFKEIETMKSNGWREPIELEPKRSSTVNGSTRTKKLVNRPKVNSAANEEARKQREAERKRMIEERRKAMKAAQNKPTIEIFVPENAS